MWIEMTIFVKTEFTIWRTYMVILKQKNTVHWTSANEKATFFWRAWQSFKQETFIFVNIFTRFIRFAEWEFTKHGRRKKPRNGSGYNIIVLAAVVKEVSLIMPVGIVKGWFIRLSTFLKIKRGEPVQKCYLRNFRVAWLHLWKHKMKLKNNFLTALFENWKKAEIKI